ncbi:hypothetical protein BC828DRAFT_390001 [Blastocladiella britannica]|nr:hypothetical protein BC828DRAFT_390001 [Blastocladiella britannica]
MPGTQPLPRGPQRLVDHKTAPEAAAYSLQQRNTVTTSTLPNTFRTNVVQGPLPLSSILTAIVASRAKVQALGASGIAIEACGSSWNIAQPTPAIGEGLATGTGSMTLRICAAAHHLAQVRALLVTLVSGIDFGDGTAEVAAAAAAAAAPPPPTAHAGNAGGRRASSVPVHGHDVRPSRSLIFSASRLIRSETPKSVDDNDPADLPTSSTQLPQVPNVLDALNAATHIERTPDTAASVPKIGAGFAGANIVMFPSRRGSMASNASILPLVSPAISRTNSIMSSTSLRHVPSILAQDPASSSVLREMLRGDASTSMHAMGSTSKASLQVSPRAITASDRKSERVVLANMLAASPMHRPLLIYHMTRFIYFSALEGKTETQADAFASSDSGRLGADLTLRQTYLNPQRVDDALALLSELVDPATMPWVEFSAELAEWMSGDKDGPVRQLEKMIAAAIPADIDGPEDVEAVGYTGVSEWAVHLTAATIRCHRMRCDIDGVARALMTWARGVINIVRMDAISRSSGGVYTDDNGRPLDDRDSASVEVSGATEPPTRHCDTSAIRQAKRTLNAICQVALAAVADDIGDHGRARRHWAMVFPEQASDWAYVGNDKAKYANFAPLMLSVADGDATLSGSSLSALGLADLAIPRLVAHFAATMPSTDHIYGNTLDLLASGGLSMGPFSGLLTTLALATGRTSAAEGYATMWARLRGTTNDLFGTSWGPLVSAANVQKGFPVCRPGARATAGVTDPSDAAAIVERISSYVRVMGTLRGFTFKRSPSPAPAAGLTSGGSSGRSTLVHNGSSTASLFPGASTLSPAVLGTAFHGVDVEPASCNATAAAVVDRVMGRWTVDERGRLLMPTVLRDGRGGSILGGSGEPTVLEAIELLKQNGETNERVVRTLTLWFDSLVVVDSHFSSSTSTPVVSHVVDARHIAEMVVAQSNAPVRATLDPHLMQVTVENHHRWAESVVSIMGTYTRLPPPPPPSPPPQDPPQRPLVTSDDKSASNLRKSPSSSSDVFDEEDDGDDNEPQAVNYFISINLRPTNSDTGSILHPKVVPAPIPANYIGPLMDPPRSVHLDDPDFEAGKNTLAVGVAMSWEFDTAAKKRRYTSLIFHIDRSTGSFIPVDVLVNFRVCCAQAGHWTIGLITGTRPQVIKLDAHNHELARVTFSALQHIHPPPAPPPASPNTSPTGKAPTLMVSNGASGSSSRQPTPPCTLIPWAEVGCVVFIAFTTVVLYSSRALKPVLQLDFSGANNPREHIDERGLTVVENSASHCVVASGRNVFVIHAPNILVPDVHGRAMVAEVQPEVTDRMQMAAYLPLPGIPHHVHCELDPSTGAVVAVHALTAGAGCSQYFAFDVVTAQDGSSSARIRAVYPLGGWTACARLSHGGNEIGVGDPFGVTIVSTRRRQPDMRGDAGVCGLGV